VGDERQDTAMAQKDVSAKLAALRAKYVAQMPGDAILVRRLAAACAGGDEQSHRNLKRLAHGYAGSGGSYGWSELTIVARRLEHATPAELLTAAEELATTLTAIARRGLT